MPVSDNDVLKLESVKPYLEYLDKEMSIMGILSTFSIATPAFAISQLAGADSGTSLAVRWSCNMPVFLIASAFSVFAALAFYRQRSTLAYWYGQIAMSISPASEYSDGGSPQTSIELANLWSTWRAYKAAFYFVYLSLFLFGLALLKEEVNPLSLPVTAAILVALASAVVSWCWRQRYTRSQTPEPPWLSRFKERVRVALGISRE